MIELTSAQLDAWLAAFMFPLARLLGLFTAAPLLGSPILSARVRLAAGLAVSMAVLPALPPVPHEIPTDSWMALGVLAHQVLIGMAIGFMVQLFFAAVDVAGEMIGLQMGLSFAVFFNPQTGGQTSVISELLGLMRLLVFLALDGHLMLIKVMVASFDWLPVGVSTHHDGWLFMVHHGSVMFASGVMLALPLVATLLITNISLGVLTRAAPQLNLFAVGFPVTLSVGFATLLLSLTLIGPMFHHLFENAFVAVDELMRQLSPEHGT